MNLRLLLVPLLLAAGSASAADLKLEEIKGAPEGLPEAFASLLEPTGVRVKGDKVICEIWLVKELATKDGFKPTQTVKYPLASGTLVGAIRMPVAGAEQDFKGQEIPMGTYTLRYGQQPQDGNHLGSSEFSDFVLACALDADKDPKPVDKVQTLFKMSAKAAGTSHPAVFQMRPAGKSVEKPTLRHENNLWILQINAPARPKALPLEIVVQGMSDAA